MAKQIPIEHALFREAPDGSTVFFPWGLNGRGYRLPDRASRGKAVRAASLLMGCTVAIGTWTAYRLQPLIEPGGGATAGDWLRALAVPAGLLAASILGYALRVWRLVEDAGESDLRVSREERLRLAAELSSPREVALAGVVLALLGSVVLWIAPHAGWVGALGVGIGLLVVAWSIAIRRAARDR